MSKENDAPLPHNYDGIEEFDNSLPTWWLALFYLTILISFFYVVYYHFGPGKSQEQILALQLEELNSLKQAVQAKAGEITEENFIAMLSDKEVIAKGKAQFESKCMACHGMKGEGTVGPNMTDDNWIHGGKLTEIRNTIVNGVPEKGMISWKDSLSSDDINSLVVYIRTLRGTNPPGAKAPEGNLYVPTS